MTRLSVPDMSCGHCKASVTSALAELAGLQSVDVDLERREVEITGSAPVPSILAALDEIGFPAQVISKT
jgi:copper chaperone